MNPPVFVFGIFWKLEKKPCLDINVLAGTCKNLPLEKILLKPKKKSSYNMMNQCTTTQIHTKKLLLHQSGDLFLFELGHAEPKGKMSPFTMQLVG